MSCLCECERIKFSCGVPTPDFTMGKCVYPEAFSIELNLQSRDDCLGYDTHCFPPNYPGAFDGFIDCGDRNEVLNNLVNGTYILTRVADENTFSYRFIQQNSVCLPMPLICGNDLNFSCNPIYNNFILINASANRCSKSPDGITAELNLQLPGWHTNPFDISNFPYTTQTNFNAATITLRYISNQPISCDGPVSFVLSNNPPVGPGQFPQDLLGINAANTIFQSQITITPIT